MSARKAQTGLQRGRYESSARGVSMAAGRSVAVAGGGAIGFARALSGVARPAAAATRPMLRVVAGGIERLPTSAAAEPLARGRFLILVAAVLGAGLIYINVGKLQAGDSFARYAAQSLALQRENTALRSKIAALDTPERIARLAKGSGLENPLPEQFKYLKTRGSDPLKAVRGYTSPTTAAPAAPMLAVQPQTTSPPVAAAPTAATGTAPAAVTTPAPQVAPAPAGPAPGAAGATAQGQGTGGQ
jgi:hypothetical protein